MLKQEQFIFSYRRTKSFFTEGTRTDVLALDETKLDQSVKDNELYIPGYEIAKKRRTHNSRNGGGVCIYIRSNLNFRIPENSNAEQLEC